VRVLSISPAEAVGLASTPFGWYILNERLMVKYMLNEHIRVADITDNMKVEGTYVLNSHSVKTAKNGKDYLDCTLSDDSGQIGAKMWDMTPELAAPLTDGCIVEISAQGGAYNGTPQLVIKSIRVIPMEKADLTGLLPTAPRKGIDMFNELHDLADGFKDEELRKVVLYVLDTNKEQLLMQPAAKSMHHAMLSGLLFHMTTMTEDAVALCKIYPSLNAELLETGTMIHDIGKLWEFTIGATGLVTDYSILGNLEGHIYMGAKYIGDICDQLKISPEKSMMLQHMILSHHGQPEYGSAITPRFQEAYVLHVIDELDAHLNAMINIDAETKAGEMSLQYVKAVNAKLYKPTFRK
jgi:3'-5' exoribonuclease